MRPTTARRRPPKVKEAAREVTAKESMSTVKKAEGIMIDGQVDDVSFGHRYDLTVQGMIDMMPLQDDEDAVPEEKRLADDVRAAGKGAAGAASYSGAGDSKLMKDIMSRQAEQEASRTVVEKVIITINVLVIEK